MDKVKERTTNALNAIKDNITKDGYHLSKAGNKITKLGNGAAITNENRLMGQKAIKDKRKNNPNLIKAKAFAESLKKGGMNAVQITAQLNANGFLTSTGKPYFHTSTLRLFK